MPFSQSVSRSRRSNSIAYSYFGEKIEDCRIEQQQQQFVSAAG